MKIENTYWVYILENQKKRFYIGSTSDVTARLAQHNTEVKIGTKFTHKHSPWQLVWQEQHSSRSAAMKREKQIKAMKSSKWIRSKLLNELESQQHNDDYK